MIFSAFTFINFFYFHIFDFVFPLEKPLILLYMQIDKDKKKR
ncbi:hypothetical protein HMPREF1984_02170 [Leptotrichia sp. oral taxon 215 str. W9775]|nr:hypothetical protein HMPREF1984_02170 [Leptotrichia sp. oral taxon 215 str. W9775]